MNSILGGIVCRVSTVSAHFSVAWSDRHKCTPCLNRSANLNVIWQIGLHLCQMKIPEGGGWTFSQNLQLQITAKPLHSCAAT